MKNLAKAVISVMKEVKGIEKSMTVGAGNFSYKGVSDKEVKEAYSKAMVKNGLCILPIDVQGKETVNTWQETNQYGTKQKQSIFTSVSTKYLLLHESGESKEIAGYGHGVDSQDKSAGKATTYALKYALLYTFMTPTGKIDDADSTHSNEIENQKPINYQQEFANCKTKVELENLWMRLPNDLKPQYEALKNRLKEELK